MWGNMEEGDCVEETMAGIHFSERLEVTGEMEAGVPVCKTQLQQLTSSPIIFRGDLADTKSFSN